MQKEKGKRKRKENEKIYKWAAIRLFLTTYIKKYINGLNSI
jgi:hypothetical protein